MKTLYALVVGVLLFSCQPKTQTVTERASTSQKPRTIVTTDGEIDDVDSFIRMLLYANEFRIEGLVYSSSMWHYAGNGKGTEFTSEKADLWGKDRPALARYGVDESAIGCLWGSLSKTQPACGGISHG
ncbi:nucleoside hydrolase-like domain-containing protein [Algoriphagus oliviformis]|uniref:nucleoside hydrolase-like domain-containing protein n=1 Tax=Algoriphagus oliviformis TaxID=2811231 RepID=UPI001F18BBB9|nr:nucleoside hydrolase-like domain-containing protein [Algoriphagus oliviformis]